MKKLLAMLTTITSLYSITLMVLANAQVKIQENKIVNNEINYLKTNNLEKLNRSKRADWYGWYYINFYGISDILKGNLGLNVTNKKIIFGGFNDYRVVHSNTVNEVYNKITIKDNNGNLIKEILYWKDKSIQTKLEEENLLNGITYQDNYTIEIWSNEPWRTKFNDNNSIWKSFAENTLYFKIKNNRIYKLDDIKETIKKTQLEALDNNDASTIKSAVKKINYNLDINEVNVDQITTTSADINGYPYYNNSNKYTGFKKIYFIIKPDLITDFKTCLNSVNDTSDETILGAVKNKNPNVDISQVYVKEKIPNGRLELGVKSGSNKYNINSSAGCNNFKVRSDLSKIINNINLVLINNGNNNDVAILNELNYLNSNLDISQLEVKEKSNVSATIRAKINSDKYFGEKNIHYSINNQTNKIINLDELIKKGIFLVFRDKNEENIVKEIKNINTNNLIYSNVIATKSIEPIYNKTNENICYGKTILENNLPTEQKLRTSNCKYTIQEIKSFQITTGLSKTTGSQTNSEVSSGSTNSNGSTSSSQVVHSKIDSSSKSWEASGNAGFNLFGFSIGGSGGGGGQTSSTSETSSLTSYSSTQDITKSINNSFSNSISLSNSFDLENSQEKQNIKIFELELPFQEINVEGNQTIEVTTFLDKVLAQIILNLKQNITGEINAEIINKNNDKTTFTISIKEIMQKLQQYNLLPQEITINNDNSISFNGKANLSYQFSTVGKTKLTEVETF